MAKNTREEWKVYKNVFSEFSLRNIFKLSTEGHFKELVSPIQMGKEANVFTAITKDDRYVIVKIYRLENCNFNKMFEYIASDPRYSRLKKQKRAIVFAWTQREFKNLMIAREGIRVPTPITFKDNILVMEMIGDPAPMLKDARPKDPEKFLKKVFENMYKLKKTGLVHGDLSEFNILNQEEEPVFIDFSQTTYAASFNSTALFDRDMGNIKRFFRKMLSEETIETILSDIQSKFKKQI